MAIYHFSAKAISRAAGSSAVAAAAYRAGAGLVTPLLADEGVTLARYDNAGDDSFDRAPGWLYGGMAQAFSQNAARMAIVGVDPMLLAQADLQPVSPWAFWR